jgi:hypothetical protein
MAHFRHQKNRKLFSDQRKMEVFFGNIYTETHRAATKESRIGDERMTAQILGKPSEKSNVCVIVTVP